MYKDIDDAIEIIKKYNNCNNETAKNCLANECEVCEHNYDGAEFRKILMQISEWLEELKELRELKDTYAKGMETSYSEFRYKQGRADGYSKAENDYFAQSQKDREDTYNCGYAIGRQDAFDECIKLIGGNIKSIVGTYNKDTPLTDMASYRVAKNELIEELVKQLEQLKEKNNEQN